MSFAKRLMRMETSLTPKQAVLLWLKEVQQLDYVEFLEKSFKSPRHEAPRARITALVGKAVHEALTKQGMKPELIANATREAQKQADFLIVLVRDLHGAANLECKLNAPYVVLLHEKFGRMLERFVHDSRFEPTSWEVWRAVLIQRLSSMWQLKETVAEISERYYEHHPLLLREHESRLSKHVSGLEILVQHYNSLKRELPAWTAIDPGALLASIRKEVSAKVQEHVAHAISTTLEDFGESEAAWKILEPYALARLEKFRSSSSVQCGAD